MNAGKTHQWQIRRPDMRYSLKSLTPRFVIVLNLVLNLEITAEAPSISFPAVVGAPDTNFLIQSLFNHNFTNAVQARWEAEIFYNFPNCNTTSTAYLYLQRQAPLRGL